jgi:hypothetical protein
VRGVALVLLLVLVRPAFAQDACDPKEAAELRAHLEQQKHRTRRWHLIWGLTFTGTALGTAAFAYFGPEETRVGSYVSAGKSTIGALSHVILPLRAELPPPNADVCADLVALRAAVKGNARRQRGTFWLNHVGGIAVNGGAALLIWKYASWQQALLSVAIGYPIGVLSNYTAPRGSWHLYRERNWTVTVTPTQSAWLVGVAGEL